MAKTYHKLREMPVRKSNLIIQKARYKLSAKQLDIITYVVSKVKPDDECGKLYQFSINEFCNLINVDCRNGWHYKTIKEELQHLADKSIWVPSDDGKKEILTRWFDEVMMDKGNGVIEVSFHKSIWKYIYEVKQNFTQYPALNSYALTSKYSKYLYDFLKSCEGLGTRTISIEDFKIYACPCSYSEYANLRQRVLEPAVAEINRYTDIRVNFEPLKYKGSRKFNYIKFTITPIPKDEQWINKRHAEHKLMTEGEKQEEIRAYRRFAEIQKERDLP